MSNFINNIRFANAGILYFFKSERNGRIPALVAVLIIKDVAAGAVWGASHMFGSVI